MRGCSLWYTIGRHRSKALAMPASSKLQAAQLDYRREANMMDGTSHSGTIHTNNVESANIQALCRTGAYRMAIAMRSIPRPKIIGAVFAAAAVLLGFTAPAQATDIVYVSNADQIWERGANMGSVKAYGQQFTTGGRAGGYDLKRIEVGITTGGSGLVELMTDSAGLPGTTICPLTVVGGNADGTFNTGTGTVSFNTSLCDADQSHLAANTKYWVAFIAVFVMGVTDAVIDATKKTAEDPGAIAGWSIADRYHAIKNENDPWTWSGWEHALQISVVGTNTPPTASGGTVDTNEDTAHTFVASDFGYLDADDDALDHVTITTPLATGTGTLSLGGTPITIPQTVTLDQLDGTLDDNLKYTPPANANGDAFATFKFKVNDFYADSASDSTMTIAVTAVNDSPTADDNTVTTNEDTEYTFTAADFGFSDADTGDELDHVKITSPPTAGTLSLAGVAIAAASDDNPKEVTKDQLNAGTLTYTPPANTIGDHVATFTFKVYDGMANSAARIITIDVTPVSPRFRRLNDEILSKHALTLADVTIAAVTSRQEAGPRCADQATTGSLGGSSSLAEILTSNAQTLTTGSLNLKQLLGTSAFRLRLTEDGAGPGCLTLWGQGDYRNLSSGDAQNLEWDGDLVTGQVGADALLRPDLLAGLAVSWSEGDFDYTDRTTSEPFSGDYSSRMVSVHPYLTWWSPIGLDVWATGGYGRGEIEIEDEEAGTYTSDTTLRLASVGASGPLLIGDGLIGRGTTTVRLKAQVSLAQMEVEGHGSLLQEQTIDAHRLRLAMEGSHERPLASGGSLTPSFEVGLRHDGGDGATGTGVELGMGLRYIDPALGLTVEGRGRVLSSYDDTYKEWGASGLIRLAPGAAGQGLSLSLVPSYGQTASGVQRLWDQGLPQGPTQGAPTTQAPTGRLEAEVGYGLAAFAGQGLVTPYGQFSLGGGTQQYRVGSRLGLGPGLRLSLEGTRQVTTVGQADQGIRLQADWQF